MMGRRYKIDWEMRQTIEKQYRNMTKHDLCTMLGITASTLHAELMRGRTGNL